MPEAVKVPLGTVVLGFDPGTRVTGWGVVAFNGSKLRHIASGTWKAPKDVERPALLADLSRFVATTLATYQPVRVGLEEAFFALNVQSSLRLGEARGAVLAACGTAGYAVNEYPPATVKKAVAGNGRADKSQVQFMIRKLLGLGDDEMALDASDALAVAVTLAVDRL